MQDYDLAKPVVDNFPPEYKQNQLLFGNSVSSIDDLPSFLILGILDTSSFERSKLRSFLASIGASEAAAWKAKWIHPSHSAYLFVSWHPVRGWEIDCRTLGGEQLNFTDDAKKSLQSVLQRHKGLSDGWDRYLSTADLENVPYTTEDFSSHWPLGVLKRILVPLWASNCMGQLALVKSALQNGLPLQAQVVLVSQRCEFDYEREISATEVLDDIHEVTGLSATGLPEVKGTTAGFTRQIYCLSLMVPATIVSDVLPEMFGEYILALFKARGLVLDVVPWAKLGTFEQTTPQGTITWLLNEIVDAPTSEKSYASVDVFCETAVEKGCRNTCALIHQANKSVETTKDGVSVPIVKPGIHLDEVLDDSAPTFELSLDSFIKVFLVQEVLNPFGPTLTLIGRYACTNDLVSVVLHPMSPRFTKIGTVTQDVAFTTDDWLVLADVFDDLSVGTYFVGPDVPEEAARALLTRIYETNPQETVKTCAEILQSGSDVYNRFDIQMGKIQINPKFVLSADEAIQKMVERGLPDHPTFIGLVEFIRVWSGCEKHFLNWAGITGAGLDLRALLPLIALQTTLRKFPPLTELLKRL